MRSGWTIQNKSSINLHEAIGVAVREYQTDAGPADYVLFVDGKPAGIVEAKAFKESIWREADSPRFKRRTDGRIAGADTGWAGEKEDWSEKKLIWVEPTALQIGGMDVRMD